MALWIYQRSVTHQALIESYDSSGSLIETQWLLANQNIRLPRKPSVLIGWLYQSLLSHDWSDPELLSCDWLLYQSLDSKRDTALIESSIRDFVYKQLKFRNTHSLPHQHSNCLLHFYKFHSCFLWIGSLFTSQILQRVNLSSDC